MEDKVDLKKQKEWEGKPREVAIPKAYIKDLHFEIVVFARKERGGSDFSFQCREYERIADGEYNFWGVVIDTSIKDAGGKVEKVRVTYHPEVSLVNVGFLVIPAGEGAET